MKKSKLLPLLAMTGFLFAGGCTFNGLMRNVWIGFGEAIGGIPADLVNQLFLADLIDSVIPDNNT